MNEISEVVKAANSKGSAKSPRTVNDESANCLVHSQLAIKLNAKQLEIFSGRVDFRKDVEALLAWIENDAICPAPSVELRLTVAHTGKHLSIVDGVWKRFLSVQVVGVYHFRETCGANRSGSVCIEAIPKDCAPSYALIDHVCHMN